MKKRLADIDKWEDPWFRNLTGALKLLWIFILDRCDNAGVWKPDMGLVSFFIDETVNEKEVLLLLNQGKERIKILENGDWFILGFIPFQYKELNPNSPPHKQVLELIKKHNLPLGKGKARVKKGLPNPSSTLKDKDIDKEKFKEKKIEQENNNAELDRETKQVYEFYKVLFDRPKYQSTEKRNKKIQARLVEPAIGIIPWANSRFLELLVAITEVSLTEFNMGKNDQQKTYIELDEHCCRNQEQVEQRLNQVLERENLEKIKRYLTKEGYLNEEITS